MEKMKRSPIVIGLLQVLGVVLYIFIFASVANYIGESLDDSINNPILGISTMLLVFVTSALICGSLVLGYPLYLFLSSEKEKAVKIVLWSVFWFVTILIIVLAGLFLAQEDARYVLLGI